jgi:cytochrome c peroxidase
VQCLRFRNILSGHCNVPHRSRSPAVVIAAVAIVAATAIVAAAAGPGPLSRAEAKARAVALANLGQRMFFDPSLSASGKLACASCHNPAHGFGPANALDVQIGGPGMDQPGLRAAPSLTYLQADPQFSEHFFDNEDEGDESVDNGPTGGLMWDGRADRAEGQVRLPLTSPFEMANADAAAVAAKLKAAPYAGDLRALFGAAVLDDPEAALDAAGQALAAFEQTPALFYPYSSKYDAYLAGKATLTAEEMRGLKAFEAEDKGNCASCHISEPANDGEPPQFTDFGLIALGVPRNPRLASNRDPDYFDLGACGPLRTDLAGRDEYCGLFRTPSLRNVALRQTFAHNGFFHSLRDVVAFYATRDTDPGRWYPKEAGGTVEKYDDLPKRYWANLNTDPPFGGKPGDQPPLSDADIDDIVAFLGTLTDGYLAPAN